MSLNWKLFSLITVVSFLLAACSSQVDTPLPVEESPTVNLSETVVAAYPAPVSVVQVEKPTATPEQEPTESPEPPEPTESPEPAQPVPMAEILKETVGGEYDFVLVKPNARFSAETYEYRDGVLSEKPRYTSNYNYEVKALEAFGDFAPYIGEYVYLVNKSLPEKEIDGKTYLPIYKMYSQPQEITYIPKEVITPVDWDKITCAAPLQCTAEDARRMVAAMWLTHHVTNSLTSNPAYYLFDYATYFVGISTGRIRLIDGTENRYAVETVLYNARTSQLYVVWFPAPMYVWDLTTNKPYETEPQYVKDNFEGRVQLIHGGGQFNYKNGKAVYDCQIESNLGGESMINRCQAISAYNGENEPELFARFHTGESVPANFLVNGMEVSSIDLQAGWQDILIPYDMINQLVTGITSLQVVE